MINLIYLFIYFILTIGHLKPAASEIQCLDESGTPVDWYVVYKLPKISHESEFISNGSAYLYITSETLDNNGWIQSNKPISDENSIIAKTLKPFFNNQSNDIWVAYNDQEFPGLSQWKFGHAKGVAGADTNGGIWLIHSVPDFPQYADKYSYPKTGHRNGQSMLCITLLKDQFDTLGQIFQYNKPYFLHKRISSIMETVYPNFVAAANGATITTAPWQKLSNIQSAQGRIFINFAKAKKFNNDLYEWVADNFKTSIFAETWLNELQPLPSSCQTYQVINVQSIKFANQSLSFSTHKDHSKWAISKSASKPLVCIGDINRAQHQEKRGGGTTCLEDRQLWKAYQALVDETSDCKSAENYNRIK